MGRPTDRMIEFAELLIEKCGYRLDEYCLEEMDFEEVSDLIDELKAELGWD